MQAIKHKFTKVTATRKGRIIAFSIVIFLIVSITGGIWYWNTHKKAIIRNKLQNTVREKSDGLYNVRYDSLAIDELAGSLSVYNMHLLYDSNRYKYFERLQKAPSILLYIQIPEINVSGVKTPKALLGNEIVGRKLEIKNPIVNIIYTHTGQDSLRVVPSKEIYEQVLGNLDLIQADTVLISGAQIITSNLKTKATNINSQDVIILLKDVKIDSLSSTDTARILFSKEVAISCSKLSWSSSNNLYDYKIDSFDVNSVSKDLHIKSFRLKPALNENAFVNTLPTQDDRFDFAINDVQLKNIDLQQLLEQTIVADSMMVATATFKIYRDLARPRDNKNRVGTYPQEMITKLPINFNIGKIIFASSFIEYKERNNITRKSGKVQFYNTYTSISNFTNDSGAIASNNIMTVDMRSRFLNKTTLNATWSFYLLNPRGRFDVKGTCGVIDATLLNPLTVPMGPARINKGYIQGVTFNLQGDDYRMKGSVKMLYEDIHVSMLEKDKGTMELDKKTLASFLANLMIKNSNPRKNEEPRVVEVQLDRNLNHSIFYLVWKTIFKGLKETVGLKQ